MQVLVYKAYNANRSVFIHNVPINVKLLIKMMTINLQVKCLDPDVPTCHTCASGSVMLKGLHVTLNSLKMVASYVTICMI